MTYLLISTEEWTKDPSSQDWTSPLRQGLTVSAYFAKLKTMWDEFSTHSKVSNYTRGATKEIQKEQDDEKLHKFLVGLDNKDFETIRS